MKTYHKLIQSGNKFYPEEHDTTVDNRLQAGVYTVKYNHNSGEIWFEKIKTNHDEIIDLPSPEYKKLTSEMIHFLKPETKQKFKQSGFLYKRSALLHGLPGTGKTVLVNRVINEVIKTGGVVLFAEDPRLLIKAFKVLEDLQPEIVTLVVMEEFDIIIRDFGEKCLLNLLDGEIQKQNVMYLATTNYINNIPIRMMRPGRMSSVIEVKYPNEQCRLQYFSKKMGPNFYNLETWVKKTQGLSVDELKEVVQSVHIFEQSIDDTIKRIKSSRDFSEISGSDEDLELYE